MSYLNTQTLLGIFSLTTVILAVAAVGHILGLSSGDALYLLSTLVIVGLASLAYRIALRRREKE